MKIECPHCGVKGRADSSYSGKMVKCPKCDILFEASPLGNGEDESPRESIAVTTEAVGDLGQENQEKQEDQEDDPLPDSKELEQADSGEQATENETIDLMDEVEQEPYGLEKEQCWQCGTDENGGEPFTARKGLLYCSNCVQQEEPEPVPVSEPEISHEELSELSELPELPDESIAAVPHFQDFTSSESVAEDDVDEDYPAHFTIIGAIREAWEYTKGAKAAIWGGSAIMYLVLFGIVGVGELFLPSSGSDPSGESYVIANILFQALNNIVWTLFLAGLYFLGIRKVVGDPISWKMVFHGFSMSSKIIIASFLQTLLIMIGFLLLILPGIYLTIGYIMTMPLIIDKGLSPWQAMETSRRAIHKIWWKVFGLFLVSGFLLIISIIPLGVGLIWSWPVIIILVGVVYRYLFGAEKKG